MKALANSDAVKAAKELEHAVALDPGYAAAHGELGVSYARLNRIVEAESQFRQAIAHDPYASVAYSNLAWAFFQQTPLPGSRTKRPRRACAFL